MSTENLKVVITGDVSDLDTASARASSALKKVEISAAEYQKKAKELGVSLSNVSAIERSFAGTAAGTAQKVAATTREIEISNKAMKDMGKGSSSATNSLFALSGIVQDAPYGFRAIGNNITFFTQQMAYSAKEAGGFGAAVKAIGGAMLGPAGLIFAISAGVSLLTQFIGSGHRAAGAADDLADSIKEYREAAGKSSGDITGQITQLQALTKAYFANKGNLQAQANIKEQLTKINKVYGSQLGTELKSYQDANKALKQYQTYLIQNALIKAQSDQIAKITTEENNKATEGAIKFAKQLTKAQQELAEAKAQANRRLAPGQLSLAGTNLSSAAANVQKIKDEFEAFKQTIGSETFRRLKPLFDQIYNSTQKLAAITNPFAPIKTGADEAVTALTKLASNAKNILPQLTGQAASTPGISNPGVPGSIPLSGAPGGIPITNPDKLQRAKNQTFSPILESLKNLNLITNDVFADVNEKLKGSTAGANLLANAFENVFSAIANGGNPFQALLQTVEQLVIKLAAAAAISAALNAIPGASGVLKIFDIAAKSFAGGGFIPSPTLAVVGDAPGGEWVLNQKQISAILNGSGGRQTVEVTGEFRMSGSDMVAQIDRTLRKQRRGTGGSGPAFRLD